MLAMRIRRLRERSRMNQTELARKALCSKSHISDIELGHVLPTASEIQLMEQALDADGVLADLLDLVSTGVQESAIVADAEHDALGMTVWEWRIPGVLQTPEYMRALMSPAVPADRLEREVAIRKARRRVLGSLVAGWFILDEAALWRVYGDREVMRGQLAHLEEVAMRPSIDIQVMPFTNTRHPGGDGPLTVVEYADRPSIWFTEGPRAGRLSDDKREVMRSMQTLNQIRTVALSPLDSIPYMRQLRESRYEQ
ncbi:MAG TPA: helix-turn-helix transcriptional regulator [Trebonia sp.]|nr:helix-turn-helix transcriptional regulator [Trebonia sp.]